MPQFRKKPVVIEAERWDGSPDYLPWDFYSALTLHDDGGPPTINTLEGQMTVSLGDWIIKGVNGEFYPCKPDIFAKTYEAVNE